MESRIVTSADAYLEHHQHSAEAYAHVGRILSRAEFMIELTVKRALEDLELPEKSNVVYIADFRSARYIEV